MTTSLVMTITDDQLREFDSIAEYDDDDNKPVAELRSVVCRLTAELRRLRAENAELAKDAGRYRWLRLSNGGKQRRAFIDADTTLRFDEAVDTFMAAQ